MSGFGGVVPVVPVSRDLRGGGGGGAAQCARLVWSVEFGRSKLGVITIAVQYGMVTPSTSWVVAPIRGIFNPTSTRRGPRVLAKDEKDK